MKLYLNDKGLKAIDNPKKETLSEYEIDFLEIVNENPGIELEEASRLLVTNSTIELAYRGMNEVYGNLVKYIRRER